MRIARLDLTRYGHFTDAVLDLGPARPGLPDLHIVYGPNEAGKSTLRSAWLDLLYGIPARTSQNFRHPYASMQIGAAIEIAGAAQDILRVKRPAGSLTDPAGRPLPDNLLAAGLGGLDRAAYETMFCLDDDTLKRGGDSILSSQGELGQLLFSASAGLAALGDRLEALRERADAFHRKSARKSRLREMRAELDTLDADRARVDLQAGDHATLRQTAAAARAARDTARDRLAAATGDCARLDGMTSALGLLPQWQRLASELAPLDGLPDVPAAWHDRAGPLREQAIRLTAARDAAASELADLTAALDATPQDAPAMAAADRLAALQDLHVRHAAAAEDLPRRRDEHDAVLVRISALTARLGGDIAPDRALLARLTTLIDDRAAPAATLAGAQAALREAQAQLDDAGGPPDPAAEDDAAEALRAALAPLRRADLAARHDEASAAADAAGQALAAAMAALAPWRGDPAALAALDAPPIDTVAAWRAQLDKAAASADAAARAAAERRDEAQRLSAEAGGLAATLGAADPAAADRARADRDAAWTSHRAILDAVSADSFAAAMAAHDTAIAAQFARAADVGQLRMAQSAAATAVIRARDAAGPAAEAAAAHDRLRAEMAARVCAVLPTRADADALAELAGWLPRRDRALALMREAAAADLAHRRAAAAVAAAAAGLSALLPGAPADLATLARAAEARLAAIDADAANRAERQRLAQALARQTRALDRARADMTSWQADWDAASALLGLPDLPAPGAMRPVLADLAALADARDGADALHHRIAAMQDDQARFAAAAADLGAALDMGAGDPVATLRAVSARIDAAGRATQARADLAARIATRREALAALDRDQAVVDAELAGMQAQLAVADPAALEQALGRLAHRDRLREQAAALATRIRADLGAADMAQAAARLAGADAATLAADRSRARADRDAADAALAAAQQALFAAERDLDAIGLDDAVARIEARRAALLLAIEDGARDWLRLRAGVLATERALASYRETHRSGMLARASDVFAAITGGEWAGLATQPQAAGEVLIARTASGETRLTDGLSKGTLFQLYLALRIAGFHEFAAARGPVPVLGDDVLETFDDDRTRRALAALADTAMTGQVVYLTHHRHVADLAREACPDARHHVLGAVSPSR